jgi:hypothetical protein
MAIQLGQWDCPVCGQKGLPGNVTACAGCGAPRGKDVEFYLPDNSHDITDETRLKEANSGVDWRCDYCGSDNKVGMTECKGCGNQRTKDDIARGVKEYNTGEEPWKQKPEKNINPPKPEVPKKSKHHKVLFFILIFIIILTGLLWPKKMKVEVVKHSWERTVEIENNRLVTEEGWNIPSGGILKYSFRSIHHYDKVFDHYETRTRNVRKKTGSESYKCGTRSKGNGYFEDKYCTRSTYENVSESYDASVYRDVPVYRTKYRYTIYKWMKDHTINAKGNDKNVKWPSENFADNNWREGKKTEKYVLFVKDKKGNDYNQELKFAFWNKLFDGQSVDAKGNSFGNFYGVEEN